ncbi:hypothetical protein NE237_026461 [Protea cynaroides]|uniref:Uncharacterized protein n=1 Tax=Protea cynaroides TaxID=273540 RepID=A0A9Q0H753_9MAGN|nr:hypothetical protein NE237_026461 [Protea cynaroides]
MLGFGLRIGIGIVVEFGEQGILEVRSPAWGVRKRQGFVEDGGFVEGKGFDRAEGMQNGRLEQADSQGASDGWWSQRIRFKHVTSRAAEASEYHERTRREIHG